MTYLTPGERNAMGRDSNAGEYQGFWDLHESHAALDEMAHKMREALWCQVENEWSDGDYRCKCRACAVARAYDQMIGDETPDTTSTPAEEST